MSAADNRSDCQESESSDTSTSSIDEYDSEVYDSSDYEREGNARHQVKWMHRYQYWVQLSFCLNKNLTQYMFLSMCMKHGFMQFFIAHTVAQLSFGIPIMLMFISIGQFARSSIYNCWDFRPSVRGLSLTMCIIAILQLASEMCIGSQAAYMFVTLLNGNSGIRSMKFCAFPDRTVFCNYNESKLSTYHTCKDDLGPVPADVDSSELQYVHKPEWGLCGYVKVNNRNIKNKMYLYDSRVWAKVSIYNLTLANAYHMGWRYASQDMIRGSMQLGFRYDNSTPVRLNHINVIFLAVIGHISLILMFENKYGKSLHVANGLTVACLLTDKLGMLLVMIRNSYAQFESFKINFFRFSNMFPGTSQMESFIWFDAVLIIIWTSGAASGYLLFLGSLNRSNYNFATPVFLVVGGQILQNIVNIFFVILSVDSFELNYIFKEANGIMDLILEKSTFIYVSKLGISGGAFLLIPGFECIIQYILNIIMIHYCLSDFAPVLRNQHFLLTLFLHLTILSVAVVQSTCYGWGIIYDGISVVHDWISVLIVIIAVTAFLKFSRWYRLESIERMFTLMDLKTQQRAVMMLWKFSYTVSVPAMLILCTYSLTKWHLGINSHNMVPGHLYNLDYWQEEILKTPACYIILMQCFVMLPFLMVPLKTAIYTRAIQNAGYFTSTDARHEFRCKSDLWNSIHNRIDRRLRLQALRNKKK